jgi:hypothetical protein
MESKAKRTLVKSAPELWGLIDDQVRMEAWMSGLAGGSPIAVEVTERDPERLLAWWAAFSGGADARIVLELAEKGFGTAVSITAQHARPDRAAADAALERVLDELGSSGRRRIAAR